jgi:hypothetical protein
MKRYLGRPIPQMSSGNLLVAGHWGHPKLDQICPVYAGLGMIVELMRPLLLQMDLPMRYATHQYFCEVKEGKRVSYYIKDGEKVYCDFPVSQPVSTPIVSKEIVTQTASFPPLQQQAKSFIQSMSSFISSGFKIAEDYEQRWETCKACERLRDGRCLECGCWMENKAKIAAERCRLGKW